VPDHMTEPSTRSPEPFVPAGPHRPWWRKLLSVLVTLAVVVIVFGFVIPELADYEDVLDRISSIDGREWAVLGLLAAWFLIAYVFVLMAALPTLRFGEGFVVQTTGTAINNSIPAGGAIALPLQYLMYLSWGFTPGAVTSAIATAGVWDQLARLALPVLAVGAIALNGDAVWWMWAVSLGGLALFVFVVWVLRAMLGSEEVAQRIGGLLSAFTNRVLGWIGREPIDMVAATLQFRFNVISVASERWGIITLATLLNHAAMTALFLASLRAVGVSEGDVSTAWVILSVSLGRLLVAIPISPGGIGLVDLGFIGLLTVGWGSGSDEVLLAAGVLLYRALSFLPPIAAGLGSWVFWRVNRSWRRDWTTERRGEARGS
jgi:putative heme transporter